MPTPTMLQERILLAISNGILYRRHVTLAATFTQAAVASALRFNTDGRQIQMTARGFSAFIADTSAQAAYWTNGTVSGTALDSASVADWTAVLPPLNVNDFVAVLTNVGGATVAGTYPVTGVAAGNLTLGSAPGNGTCTLRVERAPKVYTYDPDLSTETLTLYSATAAKGAVPTGCVNIGLYRDRIVMSGGTPGGWFMSRQGDPYDWLYGTDYEDYARAVAGEVSEAGAIAKPITAQIIFSDDLIVWGCRDEIWVCRGDPAYGGQITNVSRMVGIIDSTAWCLGPSGEAYALSEGGLIIINPDGRLLQKYSNAPYSVYGGRGYGGGGGPVI